MFRKKRDDSADEATLPGDDGTTDSQETESADQAEDVQSESSDSTPAVVAASTEDGPFDITQAPHDGMERLDFGALKLPGVDGMNVNVEMDEQSGRVVAVTVVIGEAGVQLQPFAAPRSGNFWPEVIQELSDGITQSGGQAETAEGAMGTELRAIVPAMDEEGNEVQQQVRFVAAEGPRWLLRGVMLGEAAEGGRAAEVFEDILRGCVVDRGAQPMAPGDILQMTIPTDDLQEAELDEDGEPVKPTLDDLEPGPTITEIR